jgi:tape measure domain-containing protein
MSTVDERVVEMKFNNQQFERGASQTIGTLDRLKGSLRFPSGSEMLGGLESGMRGLASRGLHGIESGVQTLGQRFTGLGVMGVTALATITNQAVMTGERLVKSLTIDPIKQGFQEYETQLNAVQTILANTAQAGVTLPQVNKALDELNTYADKTIYNFSEMAKNIGTFTAAGVALKPAVAAIKGISNLAALSGTNSERAAGAMYQLSQALAAGKVGLMDWNSVNAAGMGGSVFQRDLARTAVAMGKLSPAAVKLSGDMKNVTIRGKSFRESLSAKEGDTWLTSDVLTASLRHFTGDMNLAQIQAEGFSRAEAEDIQAMGRRAYLAATEVKTFTQLVGAMGEAVGSGWAQTWRIIFGDFGEAKQLWTDVNNVLGDVVLKQAQARNNLLGDWKALGGRTVLINSISYAWQALIAVLKPIRYAFREIFPAATGKQLMAITRAFEMFTANLLPSQTTLDKIYRTARGFFAALDIGRMIIWEVVKMVARLFGAFGGDGVVQILDITATMGDWIVALRDAIKAGDGLQKFFIGLGNVLMLPIQLLKAGIGIVQSFVGAFAVSGNVGELTDKLKELGRRIFGIGVDGKKVTDFFRNLGKVLSGIMPGLAPLITGLGNLAGMLGKGLADGFKNIKYSDILDTINTGLFTGLLLMVRNFSLFGSANGGIIKSVTDAIHAVTDTLKALQQSLKAKTIITIAIAMAILAASVIALSLVDSEKLNNALFAMTAMFVTLGIFTKVMTSVLDVKGIAKMPILAAAMILFGVAFAVLTASVMTLARLKPDELAKGLIGLDVIMGSLLGFVKLIGPSMQKRMFAAALGIRVVALSITALSKTVVLLGALSWGELIRGLMGVAVLLGALAGYTRLVNPQKMIATGIAMNIMAVAVGQLAKAVSAFGDVEHGSIGSRVARYGCYSGIHCRVYASCGSKADDGSGCCTAIGWHWYEFSC